jgi:outer membrane protein TolC
MRAMRTATEARLAALIDRAEQPDLAALLPPAFPTEVPPLDSLQLMARSGRPMIRAGVAGVAAADASVSLARREIIPDLQLGIQYGQRGNGGATERMGSLMVGASLPIFARARQSRMREEAAAMRAMATADLAVMRADTRGRVAEAHANLMRARTLAALYRGTILPQANATVASALAAYRAGAVDFRTVLDDRVAANDFRRELIMLEADEGRAWAELEMLVGRELFDPNIPRGDVARGGAR